MRRSSWSRADRLRWLARADAGESLGAIASSEGAPYGTVQGAVYCLRREHDDTREAHAFLCLGDEHVGIWVHPEDNGGRYEYSVETARERYLLLQQEITRDLAMRSARWRVTRLHVLMLGDHIQGECAYQGAAFRLQLTSARAQIAEYVEMVGPMLTQLADAIELRHDGPRVVIVCVPGNHSRPAPRGEADPHSTLEAWLWSELQDRLRDVPGVEFRLPDGVHQGMRHPLSGMRMIMGHGDGELRVSYTGAPTPVTWARCENAARHLGLGGWDIAVLGHRHVPNYIGGDQTILTNGCFCGSNDLAVDKSLKAVPACQWWFGLHEGGWAWRSSIELSWPTPVQYDTCGIVRGEMLEA